MYFFFSTQTILFKWDLNAYVQTMDRLSLHVTSVQGFNTVSLEMKTPLNSHISYQLIEHVLFLHDGFISKKQQRGVGVGLDVQADIH